jgi:hypothetical protein
MSDATTHLLLPYVLAAQAQKHITHNEALRILDGLVQRTQMLPPTWRRFDVRPIVSATCPRESVLPIRLRPDFLVVFEGCAAGAEHRHRREDGRSIPRRAGGRV